MAVDPRTPCLVGVGLHTWHPEDTGEVGAPEPLAMWEQAARSAAADAGCPQALERLDSVQVVHCLTWEYDDPPGRLAERLGAAPRHRHYSGIGGTTPQVLVQDAARAIARGDADLVIVTGAEALATQRAHRRRGERATYSHPPAQRAPFPWEAPFHPAESAHGVFEAWLTFALFDNARRAHLGVPLDEYRDGIGRMMAPMTEVAAANPLAWYRTARTAEELVTPTPSNRMVGYPYTKYLVAVMDVDQASALLLASHAQADALGVPGDRRVYLRGWCYATDPVYVAEHPDLWRSPALAAAAQEALRSAGVGADDVAHLDLYSCFASSLHFARDALGLADGDGRALTVTGGLPYHGGAGSNYLGHGIGTMARVLRADPGSYGLVSGVGMHMTKHVAAVYSTVPPPGPPAPPDAAAVQARLDARPPVPILDEHEGAATVAAYTVVHARDGDPEWAALVCDVPGGRAYARADAPDLLAAAEQAELVGTAVRLAPATVEGPLGPARVHRAVW